MNLISKNNIDGNYQRVNGSDVFHINTRLAYQTFSFSSSSILRVKHVDSMNDSLLWSHNVTEKGVRVCRQAHLLFQREDDFNQVILQTKECSGKEIKTIQYRRIAAWSDLEYCDTSTIFQGEWHAGSTHYQKYEVHCPQLYNSIPEDHLHWNFYTSTDSFKISYFYPNSGCYTLPLLKSLEIYKYLTGKDHPSWRFIGDSLVRQIDITGRCELEGLFPKSTILQGSVFDESTSNSFLRSDIDYNETIAKFTFKTSFPSSYSRDKLKKEVFSWFHQLPHDLDFLVLNTGAWYSSLHLVTPQATVNYPETIIRVIPHLEHFQEKNPHTTVFWLGLPFMKEMNTEFAWDQFEIRNQIARHFLEPLGIIYFDMESFGRGRRKIGDKIALDPLHWVSPGTFTIPSFAFEKIVHLHVMKMFQRAKMTA